MSVAEEQTTATTRRKPHKVGPFSRERQLKAVDGRTLAGRALKSIEAKLLAEIGPKASVAQRLLAKSAALKATRITLLTKRVIDEGNLAEGTDTQALAWMNGLRADLGAMGLLSGRGGKGGSGGDADGDSDDLAEYVRQQGARASA